MARIPSPRRTWPAPSPSCLTSSANERSPIGGHRGRYSVTPREACSGGVFGRGRRGARAALLVPDRVAARMEEDGERRREIQLVLGGGADRLAAGVAGLAHARARPELDRVAGGEPA